MFPRPTRDLAPSLHRFYFFLLVEQVIDRRILVPGRRNVSWHVVTSNPFPLTPRSLPPSFSSRGPEPVAHAQRVGALQLQATFGDYSAAAFPRGTLSLDMFVRERDGWLVAVLFL